MPIRKLIDTYSETIKTKIADLRDELKALDEQRKMLFGSASGVSARRTSGRSPMTLGMNWLVMNGIMQGMQFEVFRIRSLRSSKRRWPRSSIISSSPVHSDIFFFT